jgi:hypothetical protein
MKFRPLTWRQAHPYLVADRCTAGCGARLHVPPAVLLCSSLIPAAQLTSTLFAGPPSHTRVPPPHLHPRFEDITPSEAVRENPRCDRDIALYGYVRGTNWKEGTRVHIAGVGDYSVGGWVGARGCAGGGCANRAPAALASTARDGPDPAPHPGCVA